MQSFSQSLKKGETIFGVEVKGIIPTSLFGSGPISLGDDSISIHVNSPIGYSFGMMIRHNFSKMFSLETGIHMTNRIYKLNIQNSNNNFNGQSKIEYDSFEIPIQWLLYVRLGKQVYMNTILGFSFDFFPSDVVKNEASFAYYIQRDSWIKASLLASVGFEYRTQKSGFFYLGASLHSPFGNIGNLTVSYYYQDNVLQEVSYSEQLNGTYLSAEIRYFFNKKEKTAEVITY
jgi:hypothetical protein